MLPKSPKQFKQTDRFKTTKEIIPQVTDQFSHTLKILSKIKEEGNTPFSIHFQKLGEEPSRVLLEVIAQELFRLFIPGHPKTRWLIDICDRSSSVLSKEVEGFQPASRIAFTENIAEGKYHGLGEVLIVTLLINESDLKLDNIGIDINNNVIKIDGGLSFARLFEGISKEDYKITADLIRNLPFITTYYPDLWLDINTTSKKNTILPTKDKIYTKIQHSPLFQAEKNRALLKILTFPDYLLEKLFNYHFLIGPFLPSNEITKSFIDSLFPQQEREELKSAMYKMIIECKEEMKNAAHDIENFRHYVDSIDAVNDIENYANNYLFDFYMASKDYLLSEQQDINNIKNEFFKLRDFLSSPKPDPKEKTFHLK